MNFSRITAAGTGVKRWTVCSAASKLEQSEMNGFLRYMSNDGIRIVDCSDILTVTERSEYIYKDIICAGDTAFDNSECIENDAELSQVMKRFIMSEEFIKHDKTVAEKKIIRKMAEEYKNNTEKNFDLWYIQGYNTVRMIADTAVKNKTCVSSDIARLLHEI